jgi:hypothetical protein
LVRGQRGIHSRRATVCVFARRAAPHADLVLPGGGFRLGKLLLLSVFGFAQPWRTTQGRKIGAGNAARCGNRLLLTLFGSVQLTARERISLVRATRAAEPHAQSLPRAPCIWLRIARDDAIERDDCRPRLERPGIDHLHFV